MLLHKSVVHDSRVRREAKALVEDGHDVTILELASVAAGEGELDGARRRSVLPPAWVRRALPFQLYRLVFAATFVRAILAERPEVIHAHDAAMLLPGLVGRRLTNARLVYDSHELATGVPYRDGRWAAFVRVIERVGLPRCAAVITVSDGIADRLQELYELAETPAVVRNVPDVPEAPPTPDGRLRAALGIGDAPLVLHQGSAAANRGVDVLIRALAEVPAAHLVLLGPADSEWPPLREVAQAAGVVDRVHVLPPVPVDELLAWTADADVGVSLLQDTCENHRLALPNKVFEYVAAGVPVVVSDLPELRRLVCPRGVGWAVDGASRDALSSALRLALSETSTGIRERVLAASVELRWPVERKRLLTVYGQLRLREQLRLHNTAEWEEVRTALRGEVELAGLPRGR